MCYEGDAPPYGHHCLLLSVMLRLCFSGKLDKQISDWVHAKPRCEGVRTVSRCLEMGSCSCSGFIMTALQSLCMSSSCCAEGLQAVSFLSSRGRWSQPVQTTRCTCGICARGGRPSCIHSSLTERGMHTLAHKICIKRWT